MDRELLHKLKKGREHYEAREYDKAEAYLSRVVESELRYADVMNMMGVIYHSKGQLTIATDYFTKALGINPNYVEAALNLAVTYNDLGQYPKARALVDHITRLKSEKNEKIEPFAKGKIANMHAEVAEAYVEAGDLSSAKEEFQKALALCPDFVDIRTRLGQVMRDAGELEEACEEFEKAKIRRPSYLPARFSLGITYLALGDRELAKREWTAVLDAQPDNTTAAMYLKMVDHMIAQDEAAEAGVYVEVTPPEKKGLPPKEDELQFRFQGASSSMSAIDSAVPEQPASSEKENDRDK